MPTMNGADAMPVSEPPAVALRWLSGRELYRHLPQLARLRTEVFGDWPYLYAGDADYEERYLAAFAAAPGAVIVGAFAGDDDRMVGAATACPLSEADEAFARPFREAEHDQADWFYFGESVLDPSYRGRGVGVAFFREREAAARGQGFLRATFCAVERSPGDPRRPSGHVPLDAFWRRRGYAPLDLETRYAWRDRGERTETDKTMRFWGRTLPKREDVA